MARAAPPVLMAARGAAGQFVMLMGKLTSSGTPLTELSAFSL
jgi:hypothetical protein